MLEDPWANCYQFNGTNAPESKDKNKDEANLDGPSADEDSPEKPLDDSTQEEKDLNKSDSVDLTSQT